MSFYIIIFLILLFLSFRKYNKYVYWGTLLFLSAIAGLRNETIGVDTHSYKSIFTWISNGIIYLIEPGWYFLNDWIASIGLSFNVLLWIASLLTLIPLGIVCLRCSVNPQMSLFFYYGLYGYLNSFNQMRQFVAISFVLLAYSYIFRKKFFLACFLLAVSFHYSSVISLIILYFKRIYLTRSRVIFGVLISFLLGLILTDSMFVLLAGPYAGYLDSDAVYRDNFLYTIMLSILMNLLYIFSFSTLEKECRQNLWTKIFFLAIVLLNLTMQLKLGSRIILYFTYSQIIFYPMYFQHNIIKDKKIVITCILLYTALIFMKILVLGNQSDGSVYPYKTYL